MENNISRILNKIKLGLNMKISAFDCPFPDIIN